MELPQPRPVGTQGGKATHDFLSLYSSSSVRQDPTPPPGGYVKTHDFLQPLERVETMATEENRIGMAPVEKPPVAPPPPSVEPVLPGTTGTYSTSYFDQRASKPEGSLFAAAKANYNPRNDENSNCTSYPMSGFTLWDEAAAKKGKTGKENVAAERLTRQETGSDVLGGQWTPSFPRPSQSSSNQKHDAATFSSSSSTQPSSYQKKQSFMDMITSAKNDLEEEEEEDDDDDDDDDDDEEFTIKRELSSQSHPIGNFTVKVEAKTMDQKPSTLRSKHSETEQRRRSKINDRFQKLRDVIPNSDQKRDKASFLLEVIEYIQFLQDKVNEFEGPYNGWNHQPSKMMPWRNIHIAEGFIDHKREANNDSGPASVSAMKFDKKNAALSPSVKINGQNIDESDMASATTLKERGQPELTSKATPVPPLVQTKILSFGRTVPSDTDKPMRWPSPPIQLKNSCVTEDMGTDTNEKIYDEGLTIESGTINISCTYSHRLLNTLRDGLQRSGIDISQASISVKINLSNREDGMQLSSTSKAKEKDARAASGGEELKFAVKRQKN